MAHPFQAFPSLEEFCDWVEKEGGKVHHGNNKWGDYSVFVAPDGSSYAILANLEPDECIGPHDIRRLEARLGMTSPWSIPF